jgi:hypothetical protein
MQSLCPVLLHSNENNSSDENEEDGSEDNDEFGINTQGTISKDNSESGNDDDSVDFFGGDRDVGDYSVEELSVQQRVMQFLSNRIGNCKNRLNVETCLLLEAGWSVSNEKATTSDLYNQLMLER